MVSLLLGMLRFCSVRRGGAGTSYRSTIDDKVSGISLIYIKSTANLCSGPVGSKGGACVTNANDCGIGSHSKKVTWPTSDPAIYLINKTRSSSVYLEPFLPAALLADEEEIMGLLQEQFTIDSWAERVSHYEFAARTGTTVANAETELKSLKGALKTPVAKGAKRQANFENSLAQVHLHSSKKVATDSSFLEEVEEKISYLASTSGSEGMVAATDLVPIIVDIARELQELDTNEEVQADHAAATLDYVKAKFADLNSMIGALNVDITGLKATVGPRLVDLSFQGNIFEILQQFKEVLRKSGVIDAAREGSPVVSQDLLSSVIVPYKTAIESLNQSIYALQNGIKGGIPHGNFPAPYDLHRAPRTMQSVTPGLDTWKQGIEKDMSVLKEICHGLKNNNETGVNFRGVSFANRSEMDAWFELHEGTRQLPILLFQCHVTLFQRMYSVLTGDHRELKEAKVISDMKIKDYDVSAVQALHASGLPLFFKGRKSNSIYTGANTGGPKHRFEGLSSIDRFGRPSDQDGMRFRGLEALEGILRTTQNDLHSELKSPLTQNLANNAVVQSAKFNQEIFTFMSDTFEEYKSSFGNKAKAWDFVCQCVEKILTSEFQEARSLATGMDFNDPSFASKMIWCSLKIICVQEKFLEVGIANHPVLSSTCTRYLIKNSNMGDVSGLATRFEAQVRAMATMDNAISELRNQVRSATSLADKANNSLKKLKEEMAKKKDKKYKSNDLYQGPFDERVSGSKRKRGDEGEVEEEADSQRRMEKEESEVKGLKSSDFDRMRAELIKDLKVGKDAIRRAGGSSWWEWDAGSTLYFWRWPDEYRKDVRDGLEVCVEGQLPEYWARQQWPEDPIEREQLKAKLHKPVIKKYVARGFVKSLTSFFSVPKGEGDIRIVYDATKSLLNEAIWAPNFFLPSVDTVLRNSTHDTYYGDIDLGEMFLNYFLDEKLRPYAGVDITGIKERIKDELGRSISFEEKKRVLYRWERNLMGLRSSPYNSIRTFSWSEDFIRGDRTDIDNPLRWDWVKLNLPGDEKYNPSESWISKYDAINDKVAAFFEMFVDDIRSGDSGGEDACQRTNHVIASRINYLGQQDSPRKRRKVSMTPGAWSGAMIWSNKEEGLFVTCAQEKWDKAKRIISELVEKVGKEKERAKLDRKQLERDRGFLIHIARTFTQMVPYLKGIHHTLESWRFGRDGDGWKKGLSKIIRW